VIFKIIDDTVGVHWIYGGRCCALTFLRRYGIQSYRGCHEVLVETIAPYGLTGDDIGDVFNVFMNVIHHEDGSYEAKPPLAKKGDYIDLQAEMDALVAVSVCPADNGPTNNFKPTALQFQVLGD
jgi:uncharacterized protein